MSNQIETDELVRRAKDGDMAAFDELVRVFQGPMFNLAYRMVNNREDANDLTQEIFVKMYRSIGKFRGDSRFSTWLYTVAANTCRSRLRQLRRVSSHETVRLDSNWDEDTTRSIEPVDSGASPVEELERDELKQCVELAVAELPEEFRAIVVMRDLQGLTYQEISGAMECSIGTVKSRLSRARTRVKAELRRRGLV